MGATNGKKRTPKAAPTATPAPVAPAGDAFPFLAPQDADPNESPIARKRRDEIVTAATEVIATEGLHKLSLGRIEERIGMSRGQLTYYFPAKEDILLAVFDRMLARMIAAAIADAERSGVGRPGAGPVIDRVRHGMTRLMRGDPPGQTDELPALIHTFMAQVRHRPDYRRKIAAANAGWRQHLAADIAASGPNPKTPPEVTASVIMALFQGLSGQLAVDPEAFDRAAVADTCVRILAPLLEPDPDAGGES
jgi:AcrR family transcriptional regulator